MADHLTPEKRSLLMRRVRRKGTKPELIVRHALWQAGLRYRLRTKAPLPGTPDIIFPGKKLAIFIDGCFWHGCPLHGTSPKSNAEFWLSKIQRNKCRDIEVDKKLIALGWIPLRFWEHEVNEDVQSVVKRIKTFWNRSAN